VDSQIIVYDSILSLPLERERLAWAAGSMQAIMLVWKGLSLSKKETVASERACQATQACKFCHLMSSGAGNQIVAILALQGIDTVVTDHLISDDNMLFGTSTSAKPPV